jgi:uncharacterized protein (TIGR00369 family)
VSTSDHPLIERARTSRVAVADLVGFSIEPLGNGKALGWLDAGPRHANPMGTVHGGILCDVADAAMGIAFVTTLQPDESFTTMSLTINFFRPVWEARLRFDAHVVNRSKNTGYVECDVTDPEGKLIAKAMSTCTVLRGDQAKAR